MTSRTSQTDLYREARHALCGALGLALGIANVKLYTTVATRRHGPQAILSGRTLEGYHVESRRTVQALQRHIPMPRPEDIRGGWSTDPCESSTDPCESCFAECPNAESSIDGREYLNAYVPVDDTSRCASKTVCYVGHDGRATTTIWSIDVTWKSNYREADDPVKLAAVQPIITLTVWSQQEYSLLSKIAYALPAAGFRTIHANATRPINTSAIEIERYLAPDAASDPRHEPLRRAFDSLPSTIRLSL